MCNGVPDGCNGCSDCLNHNDHHPAHRTTPDDVRQLLLQIAVIPGIACPACNTQIRYNIRFHRSTMKCGLCDRALSKQTLDAAITQAQKPTQTETAAIATTTTTVDDARDERRLLIGETFATSWKNVRNVSAISNNQQNRFSSTQLSGATANVSNAKLTDVDAKQQLAMNKIPAKIAGRKAKPLRPIETTAQSIVAHQNLEGGEVAIEPPEKKTRKRSTSTVATSKKKKTSKKAELAEVTVAITHDVQESAALTIAAAATPAVRPTIVQHPPAKAAPSKKRKIDAAQEIALLPDATIVATVAPPAKPKRAPKIMSAETKELRKVAREQRKQHERDADYERRRQQGRGSFEDQLRPFMDMGYISPEKKQCLVERFDEVWQVFLPLQANSKTRDSVLYIPSILYLLLLDTNTCALNCKTYLGIIRSEVSLENPILDKQYRYVHTTLRNHQMVFELPLAQLAMRYITFVVESLLKISRRAQEALEAQKRTESKEVLKPLSKAVEQERAQRTQNLKDLLVSHARSYLAKFCHPEYHYFEKKGQGKSQEQGDVAQQLQQHEAMESQMELRLNTALDGLTESKTTAEKPSKKTPVKARGVKASKKAPLANALWEVPAVVAVFQALTGLDSNNALTSCFKTKEFMEVVEVKGKRFQDERNAMNKFLQKVPPEKIKELVLSIMGDDDVEVSVKVKGGVVEEEEEAVDDATVTGEEDATATEEAGEAGASNELDLSGLEAELGGLDVQ